MDNTPKAPLFLGLMSGTSLDGLDIALCQFGKSFSCLSAECFPFPTDLRETARHLCIEETVSLKQLLSFDNHFAEFCASKVNLFLKERNLEKGALRALGFHGQTLRHLPELSASLQSGNPALLAELTGIDVIADLRRRDIAAGGQGAPLVPAFHHFLLSTSGRQGGFLNLGGIANLTLFEADRVTGFDTGPANLLMDIWIQEQLNRAYDSGGEWAALGNPDPELLNRLLNEPYLKVAPPKSTGRELFNRDWLLSKLEGFEYLAPEDVQATLLEYTARTVADQLLAYYPDNLPDTLFVCGGGAQNTQLLSRLADLLPSIQLETTDSLGLSPDWVEACAFAWLAERFLARAPGNLSSVTGSRGPRILGALYPK